MEIKSVDMKLTGTLSRSCRYKALILVIFCHQFVKVRLPLPFFKEKLYIVVASLNHYEQFPGK
jgi:hypothetical protein